MTPDQDDYAKANLSDSRRLAWLDHQLQMIDELRPEAQHSLRLYAYQLRTERKRILQRMPV